MLFRIATAALISFAAAAQPKWLDVPFVAQDAAGCGHASIAMLMQYWQQRSAAVSEKAAQFEIIRAALADRSTKQGVSGEALKAYLQENGFRAFVIDGEPADLRQHLAKGRPVVVCLGPRSGRSPLHFAVLAGMDDADVYLNDPTRGRLFRQSLEGFLRDWKRSGNWMLLAVPAQGN